MDTGGRCETHEEREAILARLLAVWDMYPHMRLAQLVVNAVGVDPFYVEDKPFIEALEHFAIPAEYKGER